MIRIGTVVERPGPWISSLVVRTSRPSGAASAASRPSSTGSPAGATGPRSPIAMLWPARRTGTANVLPRPKRSPMSGAARPAGIALEAADPRVDDRVELRDRGALERPRDRRVQRDRRARGGRRASTARSTRRGASGCAGSGGRRRRRATCSAVVVAGVDAGAVSHRRGGTPPRGRSRSGTPRRRAWCAGSARRHRRRWASPRR